MTVTLAIGTSKGAFFLRSDDRHNWTLAEPAFPGWKVTAFNRTPSGEYLLATASNWFGAALHRSTDLNEWEQVVTGPGWPEGSVRPLTQIWTLASIGQRTYAGVDEAGLFVSDDDGETWHSVEALNEHATRSSWEPGLGGLCAHHVVADPGNPKRMWVGISAVGVFRTDDGGRSWQPRNSGVTGPIDESAGTGWCVHGLTLDPEHPERLWRQEHTGVYRSADAGDSWERIETGLPASFGFPMVRDHRSGRLFIAPLRSDEFRLPVGGRLRIFRSDNQGDTWMESGAGLPDQTYTTVLRGAMVADQLNPGGVYFGTTGGAVYGSADNGHAWDRLPGTFPRIMSLQVFAD